MKNVSVCKRFEISYAHYLQEYNGKCKNIHGHNAIIELKFSESLSVFSFTENDIGMVIDFGEIKNTIEKMIKENLDHNFLNEIPFFNDKRPTAENMCIYIQDLVLSYFPEYSKLLTSIKVWEDRDSYAEIS